MLKRVTLVVLGGSFVGKGSGPPTRIESVHPYDQSVRACGSARDQEVSFFEGSFRLASSEGYGLAPLPTQHTRFPTVSYRLLSLIHDSQSEFVTSYDNARCDAAT